MHRKAVLPAQTKESIRTLGVLLARPNAISVANEPRVGRDRTARIRATTLVESAIRVARDVWIARVVVEQSAAVLRGRAADALLAAQLRSPVRLERGRALRSGRARFTAPTRVRLRCSVAELLETRPAGVLALRVCSRAAAALTVYAERDEEDEGDDGPDSDRAIAEASFEGHDRSWLARIPPYVVESPDGGHAQESSSS
jgi:hypothetical protein